MTGVLRLSLPMTLWLVCFSAVYGLHGIVCASDWGASDGPGGYSLGHLVLMAAGTVAVVAQAALLAALATHRFGGPAGFARRVTLTLAVVGVVASIWSLAPIAVLTPCGQAAYSGTVQSWFPQS